MSKKALIRYAVVGLGDIAQVAVLPAFKNCKNSILSALVSTDPKKLKVLARMYKIDDHACYTNYEECLRSGKIDAVYIALPNFLHREYTVRAAEAKIHVLCEKPMSETVADCEAMIQACQNNQVKLMIAYRLHFEPANLKAIDLVHNLNKIGDPRIFESMHSQATNFPNVRTLPIDRGGGPSYDIGVYDINAARYMFQDEPISVSAICSHLNKPAFKNIEESMSVTLKFPRERLASIIYSFGASSTDTFRIAGTKGDLSLEPAYDYEGEKKLVLTIDKNKNSKTFKAHDHFSPEIDYFSSCVYHDQTPEPSGLEGLADIKVIEAIYESAKTGKTIELKSNIKKARPSIQQTIERPAIKKPKIFHAESPTRKKAA